MSIFDTLFNLGARGPAMPLAGIMRNTPPADTRFGSPRNTGNQRAPKIGTKPAGKVSVGWRKV